MMRWLLALLICTSAYAEEWWETPTTKGGKIILTTQSADWCPKDTFIAYIETSKQDSIYGCWTVSNDRIHVRYNGGFTKVYDKEGWEYKNDKR